MKKIFLIDDDENFCFFLKKNLEKSGYFEVAACSQPKEGLKNVREMRPDLILLDIMMPGKSGIDLAAELRNSKETKQIPVVFLTAIIKEEEIEKQKHIIGGNHYISKPVKINELVDTINKLTAETAQNGAGKTVEKVRIVTFLSREQVDFLDKLGKDALFANGYKLSRSQTLDELVTLLMELKIDAQDIDLSQGLARGILKAIGR